MSETLTRPHDFRPSYPFPMQVDPVLAVWNSGFFLRPDQEAASPAALSKNQDNMRIAEFRRSIIDALDMSKAMQSEDKIEPLNEQTWLYAIQELVSLMAISDLPSPLVLPLQNGGIGAEWHEKGLNIELRFRRPYHVYVLLEDAQNIIAPLHNYVTNLELARKALRELASRK